MITNDDIGTISDSLQASSNGKSDDGCHVNDSGNEISMKPDDEQSRLTVTSRDVMVCSEEESSFKNEMELQGSQLRLELIAVDRIAVRVDPHGQ
jgi:hypothetical protein